MESVQVAPTDVRQVRILDRMDALSCIRGLIVADLVIKMVKIMSISIVLFIKRNEECRVPFKLFLTIYTVITIARTIAFISKNRSFFSIQRIPDFQDNPDITLFNNFIEALLLFWYLIGFHWLQECSDCKDTNTLLYYTTMVWVSLGFIMFIAPLFAIILLLLLMAYIRPKLRTITYKDESDLPDETNHCTICFEPYEFGTQIKFLPCEHHFHLECVDEWFNIKDICPLCKKNINLLYDLVDPPEQAV